MKVQLRKETTLQLRHDHDMEPSPRERLVALCLFGYWLALCVSIVAYAYLVK